MYKFETSFNSLIASKDKNLKGNKETSHNTKKKSDEGDDFH